MQTGPWDRGEKFATSPPPLPCGHGIRDNTASLPRGGGIEGEGIEASVQQIPSARRTISSARDGLAVGDQAVEDGLLGFRVGHLDQFDVLAVVELLADLLEAVREEDFNPLVRIADRRCSVPSFCQCAAW